MSKETIKQHLSKEGVSRREFLKICGLLAGAMGMRKAPPYETSGLGHMKRGMTGPAQVVADALESSFLVPVIWLQFQDCAGCTEALTRSHSPTVVNLVLNKIALNYQETLFAAAGFQAESAKDEAMKKYAGEYVLVVEGSIPTGNEGYCTIGGRTAVGLLKDAAENAAAIIANGNCAAFGGLPKASPNPTGAKGVWDILTDKTVLNVPGCPAIPEVFTGVLAHVLVFGTLPELDELNRPKTFYGNYIHDRCLRRPFYEAGKFATSFDDQGAKKGWCLYKLGCKGPTTKNACATIKWDAGLSFPVQSNHPCLGCSEPDFWDGGGFYEGQSAPLKPPPVVGAGMAAGVGVAAGAAMAAYNQSNKRKAQEEQE